MKMRNALKQTILFFLFSVLTFNIVSANLSAVSTPSSSPSSNDGAIDLTITGGFAPFEISWQGPAGFTSQVEDPTDLAPGTYSVEVVDAQCGIASLSAVIVEPCPIEMIFGVTAEYPCADEQNGVIKISLNGEGELPFTWECRQFFSGNLVASGTVTQLIPSSINLFEIEGLEPAFYSVVLTDSRGCNDRRNVILLAASIEIAGTVETSCSEEGGSIQLSVNSNYSNPPFRYEWNDGAWTKNRQGLASGDYCVTVSDRNACFSTECFTVNSNSLSVVVASIENASRCTIEGDISCDGAINIDVSGNGPFSYLWSNGETTEDISSLCGGNYSVTVSNSSGCSGSTFTNICCCLDLTDPGTPNDNRCSEGEPIGLYIEDLSINHSSNSSAYDGAIDLDITGGVGKKYYNWTGPNGFKAYTQDLSGLEFGEYCVTLTDGCQSQSGCWTLKDCDIQEWNIEAKVKIACSGYKVGAIELTSISGVPGPFTYSWSNGAGSQSLFDLSGGTYCVTITDKDQCSTDRCWTITEGTAKKYWNTCTYVIECGEQTIVEETFPVIEIQHPTKCYFTQKVCTGNNQVLSEKFAGRRYALIDNCTLGRYNAVTGTLCETFYGEYRSEIVSGCKVCPDGAYCVNLDYCYYNIYDDLNKYNIISGTDLLITAYLGVPGFCQQVNYCRGIWGDQEELCRCTVSGNRCADDLTEGTVYSMSDLLDLKNDFSAIEPIQIQMEEDISVMTNARAINNDNFIVKDPLNGVIYSKNGVKEMTAAQRSEYPLIKRISVKRKITIAPNPSFGNYHITVDAPQKEKVQIRIYNLNGRILHQENWDTMQGLLSLREELGAGIYILEIAGTNWKERKKIIKLK